MAFADAHCHLQDPRLFYKVAEILRRARAADVTLLHVNATEEADWPRVAALAELHPGLIHSSFGIHPLRVEGCIRRWWLRLREQLADHPGGVGEIGLDGRRPGGLDAAQWTLFRAQWDLSCEMRRPVSIHGAGAWMPLLEHVLAAPPHPVGALLHSYSGPVDALEEMARHNLFISLGGALTRPKNQRARRIAKAVQPGHFLLESDAPDQPPDCDAGPFPFLPLSDDTGQLLSEPAQIPRTAAVWAGLRGISIEDLASQTQAATHRLFGL